VNFATFAPTARDKKHYAAVFKALLRSCTTAVPLLPPLLEVTTVNFSTTLKAFATCYLADAKPIAHTLVLERYSQVNVWGELLLRLCFTTLIYCLALPQVLKRTGVLPTVLLALPKILNSRGRACRQKIVGTTAPLHPEARVYRAPHCTKGTE
jgi:hypothetical protein